MEKPPNTNSPDVDPAIRQLLHPLTGRKPSKAYLSPPSRGPAPASSPHWEVLGPEVKINSRNRNRAWNVRCVYCDETQIRTTRDLSTDSKKCQCRLKQKDTYLSYDGWTRSISEWAKAYPEIIPSRVYLYLHKRRRKEAGYADYTDAQILFGKPGLPRALRLMAQTSSDSAELDGLDLLLRKELQREVDALPGHLAYLVFNAAKQWVDEYLTPVQLRNLAFNSSNDFTAAQLAGANYVVETVGGTTIAELLQCGTAYLEIINLLEHERFSAPVNKTTRLDGILPACDTSIDHLNQREIMALLSQINLSHLIKSKASP